MGCCPFGLSHQMTGTVYNMLNKNSKSFNHQVYQKAYQRLNLTPTERNIFQRLLGFLIRNNKPFPFSAVTMAELTGFDKRTIFRGLNKLEKLRLIERIGLGKNRKFIRGSILNKILTTVTNRQKINLNNNSTTATLCHKNLTNRDTVSYKKTSSSLKHKDSSLTQNLVEYNLYAQRITADRRLGLESGNVELVKFEDWLQQRIIST
jgi:hypothetical protein